MIGDKRTNVQTYKLKNSYHILVKQVYDRQRMNEHRQLQLTPLKKLHLVKLN